ncbi:MAG: hopanoid biosynthesis-associated RND transporter HpnN, partial [Methylicorpusculum sp.]|nr:hopanoid biosynthesis-associated RND transporter HpnN [Methylicorpusculum sp.]
MIHSLFPRSARALLRFPWLIFLSIVVLCLVSAGYTSRHLGINNNTAQLLDQDLPFQQVRLKLEQAFPQDAATIIAVLASPTPEQTALAADFVQRRLQAETEVFESVYSLENDPFFRRQGFLYLDLDQLEMLSAKLADAQPFIGYLSQHYHLAGLTDILTLALENQAADSAMPLDNLLGAIDQTVVAANQGQSHFLSWQQLLTGVDSEQNRTRRLL